MTDSRHPNETTLFSYVTGLLSDPIAVAVYAHLLSCGKCLRDIAIGEALAGRALDELPAEPLAADALERLRPRLETAREADLDRRAPSPAPKSDNEDTAEYLRAKYGARRRLVMPGMYAADLLKLRAGCGYVRLLQIKAGVALPHHGHHGREAVAVLQGAYEDETGIFNAGDFVEADADLRHRPRAIGDVDCVCVLAEEAPLAFSGFWARALQPLSKF